MDSGDMLDLSLNEVENLAMKAARGAGLSWGQAEDLGRAARWLAGEGCDWASDLLALLESPDLHDPDRCAATAGLGLADRLPALSPGEVIRTGPLSMPRWLLPTLAHAAIAHGATLSGEVGDLAFSCDAGGLRLSAPLASLPHGVCEARLCRTARAEPLAHGLLRQPRSATRASVLARLEHYIHRTYVPNSEKSRLRGAGAPGGIAGQAAGLPAGQS
ncbi:DUF3726 domain-containing protein [Pseudogemmobacter humi]|uniref:DUF3726 domain-containing protein n=1 Tax=Pseudogemmobacter humi TaxID=2483812 RepID=A0A3P5XFS5_9RHOB|nr:DUF3726 domain-containing protein [Pseudogemmobacter humi]VDC33604.1 hypothetical protein XINFAN_03917 [Pseudogemmobacter humi]